MRTKFIISSAAISFTFALFLLAVPAVKAQEAEVTVVDEVIAQVNEDVDALGLRERPHGQRHQVGGVGPAAERHRREERRVRQPR